MQKTKTKNKNNEVSIQSKINELTEFAFKKLKIKRETYAKAEAISNIIGKTVPETIESFINELYEHRGILKKWENRERTVHQKCQWKI